MSNLMDLMEKLAQLPGADIDGAPKILGGEAPQESIEFLKRFPFLKNNREYRHFIERYGGAKINRSRQEVPAAEFILYGVGRFRADHELPDSDGFFMLATSKLFYYSTDYFARYEFFFNTADPDCTTVYGRETDPDETITYPRRITNSNFLEFLSAAIDLKGFIRPPKLTWAGVVRPREDLPFDQQMERLAAAVDGAEFGEGLRLPRRDPKLSAGLKWLLQRYPFLRQNAEFLAFLEGYRGRDCWDQSNETPERYLDLPSVDYFAEDVVYLEPDGFFLFANSWVDYPEALVDIGFYFNSAEPGLATVYASETDVDTPMGPKLPLCASFRDFIGLVIEANGYLRLPKLRPGPTG